MRRLLQASCPTAYVLPSSAKGVEQVNFNAYELGPRKAVDAPDHDKTRLTLWVSRMFSICSRLFPS